MATDFGWALDHLQPGETYFAMVAATDENDDRSHALGEFITLSERTIHVTIGDLTVDGGPQNVVDTDVCLRVGGHDFWMVDTGSDVSSVYVGVARHVDLVLFTFRQWETSQFTFCEGLDPDVISPLGDSDCLCGSWKLGGARERGPRRDPGGPGPLDVDNHDRDVPYLVRRRCPARRLRRPALLPLQCPGDARRGLQLNRPGTVRL